MRQFHLVEITTKDRLVHQGIFFAPSRPGKKAILWVHGLTGRFYGDVAVANLFAKACEQKGFGFASFNTRGHDMVVGIRKVDKKKSTGYAYLTFGAGYEKFEDCVFDIDAAVSFLAGQGFMEIILVGHSTGANKVCFYAGTKQDGRVAGVVLAGSLSDRLSTHTDTVRYKKNMSFMRRMVQQDRGDELFSGYHFFPMTPKRWLSLLAPGSKEDVFNYGDKNALKTFSRIRKPTLVVLSGKDEVADRPIEEIKKIFDSHTCARSYKSIIIPNATHSYTGKEKEFVNTVTSWAQTI